MDYNVFFSSFLYYQDNNSYFFKKIRFLIKFKFLKKYMNLFET